jgi:hypothetical protein
VSTEHSSISFYVKVIRQGSQLELGHHSFGLGVDNDGFGLQLNLFVFCFSVSGINYFKIYSLL